jgi:hypothetical protein
MQEIAMAYPTAKQPGNPEQQAAPPTEAERQMAEATEYYYRLRPGAIDEYNKYFLTRTPAYLQDEMNTLLAPDLPKLMISDTQPVRICDAQGTELPGSPGHAHATSQYEGYIIYEPPPPPPEPPLGDRVHTGTIPPRR